MHPSEIKFGNYLFLFINRDNLQHLICETSRIFRKKKREYFKGKINELETNNKNKNIRDFYRGINGFTKGTNLELIL
jgi:hypothetical protein